MIRSELVRILDEIKGISVAVIGDFALDRYFIYDTALNEPSLETGLTAYQVVRTTKSPGASGSVAANLAAMGIGGVYAVGLTGTDGAAHDLKDELDKRGINDDYLIKSDLAVTPQYIKTVKLENSKRHESNRFDIKNFEPTPVKLQKQLSDILPDIFKKNDAVIILDQMAENDCGVVTGTVRNQLIALAGRYDKKIVFVDSRVRIGLFDNMVIKCNNLEACATYYPGLKEEPSEEMVIECGQRLFEKNKKPVFITSGKKGMVVFDRNMQRGISTADVPPPLDIVGAGDSVTAAVVSALTVGASAFDAGFFGNVVASVTIRQIGMTGTATPQQILDSYDRYFSKSI